MKIKDTTRTRANRRRRARVIARERLEQTELDTQIKAAGFLSGCLTALVYTINNPTGKTFIDRFMPWLLNDEQQEAIDDYVGKHRKD